MPCCTVVVFDSRLRDCIMNGDYIGPSMIEILMITKICLRRKITLSPYKSFAVALGCDALSSNKLYLRHDSVVHYVSANGSNAIDYVLELVSSTSIARYKKSE
ncbi:Anaerobic glycerol-3-phosphate dehydrogenase subunit [Dirofilaria immitis]